MAIPSPINFFEKVESFTSVSGTKVPLTGLSTAISFSVVFVACAVLDFFFFVVSISASFSSQPINHVSVNDRIVAKALAITATIMFVFPTPPRNSPDRN
ncbi:hypothetical protein NDK25_09175 [Niallia taxi]|nr:hypothetical protein [Niallia taxi]MDE5052430.1 hypothetical protein [Niallia taxi]